MRVKIEGNVPFKIEGLVCPEGVLFCPRKGQEVLGRIHHPSPVKGRHSRRLPNGEAPRSWSQPVCPIYTSKNLCNVSMDFP